MKTITCEHCDSEIDVEKDPRCVVYDPSGATDVICKGCREAAFDRWKVCVLTGEIEPNLVEQHEAYRNKRGWRA